MTFGPNVRTSAHAGPVFHHRSPEYHALLRRAERLLHEQCGIPAEYDLFILSGSGTLANEAVLASLRNGSIMWHPDGGEFTERLRRLAANYHHPSILRDERGTTHWGMTTYETAVARYCEPVWPVDVHPADLHGVRFADCVSSFPYYSIPDGTDVWTTVSSKQIGALPVLGIVGVRPGAWAWLRRAESFYSILNLRRYAESYWKACESPHTPAMALIVDLVERLEAFDVDTLRTAVDHRRAWLREVVPFGGARGDGPVAWIADDAIPLELAQKWRLYRPATGGWQLFLYSGTDAEYEQFFTEWQQHG